MILNLALLGGLVNMGSQFIKSGLEAERDMRAYSLDKAQAEHAFELNQEAWRRQNAYNTPKNQMLRFKQAGLNPNLIYGQGTAGNASELPKYEQVQTKFDYNVPNFTGVISAYQDVKLKQAQTDNVEQATKVAKQHEISEIIRQHGLASDNVSKSTKAWLDDNLKQSMFDRYQLQNDQIRSTTDKNKAQTTLTELKSVYQKHANALKEIGIEGHDHPIFRFIVQEAKSRGITPWKMTAKAFKDLVKSIVGNNVPNILMNGIF